MSKQTAVQILVESMTTSDVSFYSKEIAIALQMEREQIIDFCQMWEDSPLEKYDCKEDLFIELYGK
jgi:hypothetical protein